MNRGLGVDHVGSGSKELIGDLNDGGTKSRAGKIGVLGKRRGVEVFEVDALVGHV